MEGLQCLGVMPSGARRLHERDVQVVGQGDMPGPPKRRQRVARQAWSHLIPGCRLRL
jgi:hypothetical protein